MKDDKEKLKKSEDLLVPELEVPKLEECPHCKEKGKKGELEKTERYTSLNPIVYCKICKRVFYERID